MPKGFALPEGRTAHRRGFCPRRCAKRSASNRADPLRGSCAAAPPSPPLRGAQLMGAIAEVHGKLHAVFPCRIPVGNAEMDLFWPRPLRGALNRTPRRPDTAVFVRHPDMAFAGSRVPKSPSWPWKLGRFAGGFDNPATGARHAFPRHRNRVSQITWGRMRISPSWIYLVAPPAGPIPQPKVRR